MKKTVFLLVVISSLSWSGCTDFLDRQPLDQITQDNFYNSATDADRAVLSIYSVTQGINWYGKSWMITEIPSDNTTTGGNDPDFSPIDNFTISSDNGPNTEFWTEHYRLITLSNQVLQQVPNIEMDADLKNSYLAEARFMRGYSYFDLVRIYGGVPLIEEVPSIESDLMVERNSVEEVYDFIIEDLQFAVDNLPETRTSSNLGRATRYAAAATLSKVYLTTGNYDGAASLARLVINSGRYRLMDDFGDNFRKDLSDNNAESIFQIQYVGCGPIGTGNALQSFFAPWGQGITKNSDGWGSQIPTSPMIDNPGSTVRDIYDENDTRKYHTIMTPGDFYPEINAVDGGYTYPVTGASRGNINIKKYIIGGGPDVCYLTSPQNLHVIRYADVLLSLVEAETAKNGGISVTPDVIDAFNLVRQRAGLSTVSIVRYDDVFLERRREFAFENKRWFDLLRSGMTLEVMRLHGKSLDEHNLLFPIPAQEIAINPNLIQNEGYQ